MLLSSNLSYEEYQLLQKLRKNICITLHRPEIKLDFLMFPENSQNFILYLVFETFPVPQWEKRVQYNISWRRTTYIPAPFVSHDMFQL